MLINLWYVAEWSEAVKDKPTKAKVLGQNIVLFRNEQGEIQCLADVCLHRGGSLGEGWVAGDNVVCPYHGWEYDGQGSCKHIPSEGRDFKISKRFQVDSYDALERYGMIWVFMGDLPEEERFPIPEFPEYDDPQWRIVKTEGEWKAEAARVVENGIDIAHASFVHPTFGYNSTCPDNYIEAVEKHEWWGRATNVLYPPALKGSFGLRRLIRKDRAETKVHSSWYLPGYCVRMQIDVNPKWTIVMFDANTPVDEHTTRTFLIQGRNFFRSRLMDRGSLKRLEGIFKEDLKIVEAANPYYLPETLQNEVSVASDKFMSSFRYARRKLIENKGWQIDSCEQAKLNGRKVLTVPSTARRQAEIEGREWVFEKVPLVAPLRAEGGKEQKTPEAVTV